MAIVDLGKLRFDWKGDFSESIAYENRDVIRYDGDIYIFTTDHAAGSWNPSEASLMLVSADVTTTEGDIIIANSSGLQTRLPINYDHANDKAKVLTSVSTTPAPATQNKSITVSNDAFFVDTVYLTEAMSVPELDTLVFDLSDASNSGHNFAFSTLENGIHGGNFDTHVSTVTNGGTTLLQVSSNSAEMTDGGTAVETLRTIYSYVSDSTSTPTYVGSDYPYIVVKGTLSYDSSVTATLSTQNVNGVNILTVNGRPAYQYASETDYTTSDAVSGIDWVCFDAAGNTTNTSVTNGTSWSFDYSTGITFSGTQGSANATATWVIPSSAPDIYVYDKQEASTPAVGFAIAPFVHVDSASAQWADSEAPGKIIQVHRSLYTGGAWETGTSYTTIPGSSHTFTPQRSDTKIRYKWNFAYGFYHSSHAIQHMKFYRNGSSNEACRWTIGVQNGEGRDTFTWTFDSWGAGVANELNIKTREYSSNGHMCRFHTTRYFDGSSSYQNCYAQLEITEYLE